MKANITLKLLAVLLFIGVQEVFAGKPEIKIRFTDLHGQFFEFASLIEEPLDEAIPLYIGTDFPYKSKQVITPFLLMQFTRHENEIFEPEIDNILRDFSRQALHQDAK